MVREEKPHDLQFLASGTHRTEGSPSVIRIRRVGLAMFLDTRSAHGGLPHFHVAAKTDGKKHLEMNHLKYREETQTS